MSLVEKIGYKSWRHFRNAYLIILGLGILSAIFRYFKFVEFSLSLHINFFIVSGLGVIFIWESLRLIDLALNLHFPYERNLIGRIVLQIFLGSLFGLFVRVLIYYFAEPYFPFQLDDLFLAVTWALYIIFPSAINLVFFTGYFITKWKEGIIKTERLEKEKTQVQFDNLKNQLNPHFLFNALTSLNSLIREDPELASQFLQHLSKVYRYVLQHKDEGVVSLQTEVDFIRNYIFLAETRFDKALSIDVRIQNEYLDSSIVPVTMQVLLENAFKHNISEAERPLHILISTENEYLIIRNNLQKRNNVEGSNKLGLENLKSLYRYLTDRPVIVEETESQFTVKVPLL